MKFGKHIQDAAELLCPQFLPFWMNYKALKKLIKHIVRLAEREQEREAAEQATAPRRVGDARHASLVEEEQRDAAETDSLPEDADPTALEKQFLKLLHAELGKTNQFFRLTQQSIQQRCALLRERMVRLSSDEELYTQVGTLEIEYSKLMRACVHIYKEVLALEKYAILNYTGFDKILKKHDKCTRYNTRAKYMKHFVQRQDFVRYPELLRVIANVESLFRELGKKGGLESPLAPMAGEALRAGAAQADERLANGQGPARSEAELALSDMKSASAEMATLAHMQRSTLSPAARARNTADETTAASVLASGLVTGIPTRRGSLASVASTESMDSLAAIANEAQILAMMEHHPSVHAHGVTRSAGDAGLDDHASGEASLARPPKLTKVGS